MLVAGLDLSISANPSLYPDDDREIGRGALLGCISDRGAFAGDEVEGVRGAGFGAASLNCVTWPREMPSSCSGSDVKLGTATILADCG